MSNEIKANNPGLSDARPDVAKHDAARPDPASHEQPARSDIPQVRTLLLTDLVDSTTLVERLGDGPAAELFRAHDRLVLELQQRWRGRLIDRSDGLLLLFERPVDALGFALDYNRGLRALGERPELQQRHIVLQARAGLHVGEVLTWRNSEAAVQAGAKPLEVEGIAKPLAGRLMMLARPGQILLSATAEPMARRSARELGERSEHLIWKSHGRWRLKGMPDAQELFEVGEPGYAPLRAPRQNSAKAWRDIPLWRRPAALAAEVLLLVGMGTGLWFITKPQPAIAFSERDWVVVGDLRNLTGQAVLDESLEQAFRISLEQSRYVNVLSDMKARDTLARMQRKPDTTLDRAVASEIAIRDGVRAVILPTVSEVGGRVRVSAEVIDPHTQTTVYAESADGAGIGSALGSIDDVTAALRGRLGEALKTIERDSAPLPQVSTSNLDALRAYALGQKAFIRSQNKEARGYFERAVEVDPDFALAYLGILRAYNASGDLTSGLPSLRKASSLSRRLPPRERLYLDAWAMEVDAPENALKKWRLMTALYPDFFPAKINVAYGLYVLNRYAEAMPYAKHAAMTQSDSPYLAWDLVGRLALAMEEPAVAEQAFRKATTGNAAGARMRLADTYAMQRRFTASNREARRVNQSDSVLFDRVSVLLDEGRWQSAVDEADGLLQVVRADSLRGRAAILPSAVARWMQNDHAKVQAHLTALVDAALASVERPQSRADATEDAYMAIAAGIFAQRFGNETLANRVRASLRTHDKLLAGPPTKALLSVMDANSIRASGRPEEAVARLESILDGAEPFQVHVGLLEAYAQAGELGKATSQAEWLTGHRGRAYMELGCGWCLQPLNVVDTTLARLRLAELFVDQGKKAKARAALSAFDKQWQPQQLPGYLRTRRDKVFAASR